MSSGLSGNVGFGSCGGHRQQLPFCRPQLPREWAQQPAKRQRIRDASNSDPFLARSVVRKPQQQAQTTGAILSTNDKNVFYRQNVAPANGSFASWQQSSSFQQQPLRNDLAGGSGVGAGSYSVEYGQGGDDNIDYYDDEENSQYVPRASTRGRRKAASSSGRGKRPSSRSKSGKTTKRGKTKSKGGWGRGKRGGWSGKRGGRGGGRSNQRGGGGRTGSTMESQSDAFLANVGGASIQY